MIVVEALRPSECSQEQLAAFKHMVLAGGEVARAGIDQRIRRAEYLAFIFDDNGTLEGIGALKKPNLAYRNDIFHKAGVGEAAHQFAIELGWLFVDAGHRRRGYSKALIKKLLGLVGGASLYSTTRTDNIGMKKALYQFGFSEAGQPYISGDGQRSLQLWARPPL